MPNIGPDTQIDVPRPDRDVVPHQRFWVMSYVAPEGARVRSDQVFVKCSGAFETEAEASAQAERIRNADNRVDVWVVDMYKYIPVPVPAKVQSLVHTEHEDPRLTRLMEKARQDAVKEHEIMEARMRRDRERALVAMRKAHGGVLPDVPDVAAARHEEQRKQDMGAPGKCPEVEPPRTFSTDSVLKAVADMAREGKVFDMEAAKALVSSIAVRNRMGGGNALDSAPLPQSPPQPPPS